MLPVACKQEVSRDRHPKSILADKGDVDEHPDNRQAHEKQGDEEYVVERGSPPRWLAHDCSDSLTGSKRPRRTHPKVVACKRAIVSFASRSTTASAHVGIKANQTHSAPPASPIRPEIFTTHAVAMNVISPRMRHRRNRRHWR